MKCEICGVSCFKEPLYRNAPKGVVPAKWRCLKHTKKKYLPTKVVQQLAEDIINVSDS